LPPEILRWIYFAFVRSHLLCGIEICGNTTANHLFKLSVLNNKLLCILQHKPCKTHTTVLYNTYTVSQKKTSKIPPNLTIFGTMMANCLKLYEVYSFSTSTNSRQCITVLNADVPKCYITL